MGLFRKLLRKQTMSTYTYNEWTIRRSFRRMHDKPSEGVLVSKHQTLASARKSMTPDSYIYNEEYHFTVLPQHFGMEPEASALATLEHLEGDVAEEQLEEEEVME
jgi:hypothetical protein